MEWSGEPTASSDVPPGGGRSALQRRYAPLLRRGKRKDSSGDAVAQLSALLAVACERADVEQTSMFAALRAWQVAHPKFTLI